MRGVKVSIACLFCAMAFVWVSAQQARPANRAVLFEGARLISGDGGLPIENSAFLVEGNKIARVGKMGDVRAPAGATRVDLSGKTVIPSLIDIHNHLGWTDLKTNQATKESYTRGLVIDHLQRYAYYGIAATLSMGLDRWSANPDLPYQLRNETIPNAARFLTAGRGIAATPMAGPPTDFRVGVPYGAETEAEGIARVHDLHARKVEMIKIWVDDRLGTVPKLKVPVYEAIINEAHKNGMRVVAHIFDLSDAKQLLKSGIDGFAHTVRDKDVDDEYMTILKQHPKVWAGPNLPGRTLPPAEAEAEIEWVSDALPPSQVQRLRDQLANRVAGRGGRGGRGGGTGPSDMFGIQCRNNRRVHAAGMILGLGTDANGDVGSGVHTELADMVFCGLTPAEAIVAGTRTGAEILKLKELGTVANGKSADFIVLDANPLDNILNTRKINKVYLRGTEVDRAGLSRGFTAEPRSSDDHK